jgi:hypothetical protein
MVNADMPDAAKILLNHYREISSQNGLATLSFSVNAIPISLNHQHEVVAAFVPQGTPGSFVDKLGRTRRYSKRLREEAKVFRQLIVDALGDQRHMWRPTGITAAVILFESPEWVTARRLVREMDVDNKVKPMLDATEKATNVPDELHWQVHQFKVLCKRKRTRVFLFDLGEIVDYHY